MFVVATWCAEVPSRTKISLPVWGMVTAIMRVSVRLAWLDWSRPGTGTRPASSTRPRQLDWTDLTVPQTRFQVPWLLL